MSESQQSCLDLPVPEVNRPFGILLFGYLILSSGFRSGVVDASFPPSFVCFSFQRVILQIDGEQFPKPTGNCTSIFIIFNKSELRAVPSFWIFEIASLISCLLSYIHTYLGRYGLLGYFCSFHL